MESNTNASGALTITAQHEAPQATATVVPDAPARHRKKQLSAEDFAELTRLQARVQAEPTSFRAQQELASFKTLKGIS